MRNTFECTNLLISIDHVGNTKIVFCMVRMWNITSVCLLGKKSPLHIIDTCARVWCWNSIISGAHSVWMHRCKYFTLYKTDALCYVTYRCVYIEWNALIKIFAKTSRHRVFLVITYHVMTSIKTSSTISEGCSRCFFLLFFPFL